MNTNTYNYLNGVTNNETSNTGEFPFIQEFHNTNIDEGNIALKHKAKKEMALQIVPGITQFIAENVKEPKIKAVLEGYSQLIAEASRELQLGTKDGLSMSMTPETFYKFWNEYKNLQKLFFNPRLGENKINELPVLGNILGKIFLNQQTVNNLVGAGIISNEEAAIGLKYAADNTTPLPYLFMLLVTYFELTIAFLKALPAETNVTTSPEQLVMKLMEAIANNNNKSDIEKQQLNELADYGVINRGTISRYSRNYIQDDLPTRIMNLATKNKALWNSNDYKYEAYVNDYLATGNLPPAGSTLPVNGPTENKIPEAFIVDPNRGVGVMTPNGFDFNNGGNIPMNNNNTVNDNSNPYVNMIQPQPQARAIYNTNPMNQPANQTQGVMSAFNSDSNSYVIGGQAPNYQVQPNNTYNNNMNYQPNNNPYNQVPIMNNGYNQPLPGGGDTFRMNNTNNTVNYNQQPAYNNNQNYGYQPQQPMQPQPQVNYTNGQDPRLLYSHPSLVNANNPYGFIGLFPNNPTDKNVSDILIRTGRIKPTNQVETRTNLPVLTIENDVELKYVTQNYYEFRRRYLSDPQFAQAYNLFERMITSQNQQPAQPVVTTTLINNNGQQYQNPQQYYQPNNTYNNNMNYQPNNNPYNQVPTMNNGYNQNAGQYQYPQGGYSMYNPQLVAQQQQAGLESLLGF